MLRRQSQRIKDALGELIVPDAALPGCLNRCVEGRAHEAHFDEIVEVPGLQRGVLPIVSETEQLARFLIQRVVPSQCA